MQTKSNTKVTIKKKKFKLLCFQVEYEDENSNETRFELTPFQISPIKNIVYSIVIGHSNFCWFPL